MRVALVQLSLGPDLEANLRKCLDLMGRAARAGAELIGFPEIQLSPFFPQYRHQDAGRYRVDLQHPAILELRALCRELGVVALPNVYLNENGRDYDASLVIDADGSIVGVSKMVHITQVPGFYERDYYTPSDAGFRTFDTAVGRIGVVVCYDRHFPESFRHCKLQGAQLVVVPTANHKAEPIEKFEWEIRIPAMQNELFVAMCNRVGIEGQMDFCGQSIVVDPNGDVLAKADDTEQILYADLALTAIDRLDERRQYLKLRNARFCSLS